MQQVMKQIAKQALTAGPFRWILRRLGENLPRVLVYHRFAPHGARIPHRVSAGEFAWQLDAIGRRFRVISLAQCLDWHAAHGDWPKGAVVLTVDDGYRDMYQWAYPELKKRGMPATFFVTTRFIDGELWLWPDRLNYALSHTRLPRVMFAGAGTSFDLPLRDARDKAACWRALSNHCIGLGDASRREFIEKLEGTLQVELPAAPPEEYRACNWDEIREMHRNGIEIGSHTTNHPILSKIDPALLADEIRLSKEVIEGKLGGRVASFCYPNSAPADINEEVVEAVRGAGYRGAVFGIDLSAWDDPFRTPRMAVSEDRTEFLWKLHGGEMITTKAKRCASRGGA